MPACTLYASSEPFGATVTVTVLVEVCPEESFAVYWNVSEPENPPAGVYVYEPSAATVAVPCAGVVFETTDRPVPRSFASTPEEAGTDSAVPVGVVAVSLLVVTCVAFSVFVKVTRTSVPSAVVAAGNVKVPVVPVPLATVVPVVWSTAFHVVS